MSAEVSVSDSRLIARILSRSLLTFAYGLALLICKILPRARVTGKVNEKTVLAIGTFHNPNWFFAHLLPLSRSGVKEVILVCDGHVGEIDGVRTVSPHPLMARLFSRAGAKFIVSLGIAIRHRPALYMGYAIFPAATTALILGRVFRGRTCFQLTSGSLELAGGGNRAENRVLSSLGTASRTVERLAHALTRQFDLMVVRGSQAEGYIRQIGFIGRVATITGSVEIPTEINDVRDRRTDLVFVGRFTERKRPDRFVELIELVKTTIPDVRAAMVGDGPDLEAIKETVATHNLQENVEILGLRSDVSDLLLCSKIFVLTSRWEGLSIAMMEAMAAGCIPVVNDVGDLRDMVETGKNGYLVDDDNIDLAVTHIVDLLKSPDLQYEISRKAHESASCRSGRDAIAYRWNEAFCELFDDTGRSTVKPEF